MRKEKTWWLYRAFLYVGRMSFDKGVDIILKSWLDLYRKYPCKCPPLWLVGGTPEEVEEIRNQFKNHRDFDLCERIGRIHWWGYLEPSGISTLLLRSLVLIAHSRYEPGGRVVLEAMTEGVPIIATPHGFAYDLIENWINGFLVEFGDQTTLTERMEHFIHQPFLRNVFGENAKQRAINELDTWNFLGRHLEIYDLAINSNNLVRKREQLIPRGDIYLNFNHRRFCPTYPFIDKEPQLDHIVDFVESNINRSISDIKRDARRIGSSLRWILKDNESKNWIVKWPYSRIATKAIWDPSTRRPLVYSAKKRMRSELFSSSLSGFAPITAVDEHYNLFLRPFFNQFENNLNLDQFVHANLVLETFYTNPLPDSVKYLENLDIDWSDASREEAMEAKNKIQNLFFNDCFPWNEAKKNSLRLSWRLLELNIMEFRIRLCPIVLNEVKKSLEILSRLSIIERELPLVISHGSFELVHCVKDDSNNVFLIDGENIHLAWFGEDHAALIGCGIYDALTSENEYQTWIEILNLISKDVKMQAAIVAWAGLLAFEDISKYSVYKNELKVERYMKRIKILERLAVNLFL